jgi:hypothetical protein
MRGKCFIYFKGEPVPRWFAVPSRRGPHWPLTWTRDVELVYLQDEGVEIWPLTKLSNKEIESRTPVFWFVDGPREITTRYNTRVHHEPRIFH